VGTQGLARLVALVCLTSAGAAGRVEAQAVRASALPAARVIDVPYLPQTGLLCGGAALAMVLRHLGDRRVTVDEFEPLVDEEAGGIASDVLAAEAGRRGWITATLDPTLAGLAASLASGQPPILLIEDRPDFYHYVVLVGIDQRGVLLHDPIWGPARHVAMAGFLEQWDAARRWALVVGSGALPREPLEPRSLTTGPTVAVTPCDQAVDEALEVFDTRGAAAAAALLEELRLECPGESRPVAELAAVRFSERRWDEASSLAARATVLNPSDAYAWDVLGSSRFLRNDRMGALDAWNEAGRPRIDIVRFGGLQRTRYALIAELAGLRPGAMLTADILKRAQRRVQDVPIVSAASTEFRPQSDGYVAVDATVIEKPSTFSSRPSRWIAPGLQAAIDREIGVDVPVPGGQGGLFSATWRWWDERPRVGLSFAAPRTGWWPGVWRVDVSHEAETYSLDTGASRETRTRGALGVSQWVTGSTWYQLTSGFDRWESEGHRTIAVGGRVEQEILGEGLVVGAGMSHWFALGDGDTFATGNLSARARTAIGRDVTLLAVAGLDLASSKAPFAVWSGADTGSARPRLLRAHALLDDGVVTGAAFGRSLRYGTVELARPLAGIARGFVDVAAFIDVVSAARGLRAGVSTYADYGAGLRVRVPGRSVRLRIDYARGVFDGAHAVSIGWAY